MDGLSTYWGARAHTEYREFQVPPAPGGVLRVPQCVENFQTRSTGTAGQEVTYKARCTRDSGFFHYPVRKYPLLRDQHFIGECHCTLEGFNDAYSNNLDFRWKGR